MEYLIFIFLLIPANSIQSGLSRDEIGAIRLYFTQQVDQFIEQESERRGSSLNDNQTNANAQHLSNSDDNSNRSSNLGNDQDARLERLQMEEAWMNAQGPHSEFRLNLNANNPLIIANRNIYLIDDLAPNGANANIGTDRDFAWGFTLGFLIGFMMMFFVWMPTVPHKQKLGILTGLSLKIMLTLHEKNGDDNF